MRILMVQMQACSAERVQPKFNQWLGVLAAVLRRQGHQLDLLAFSRYQAPELHEAICRCRPQAIYLNADRFAADVSRHAVEFVGRHHALPVIVGGTYAAAQPAAALSIPGVLAVVVGEPELCVPQFLWALAHGEAYERTPGMWINPPDGGPAVRNEPAAPTARLDSLPHAERELFDYHRFVERTHAVEISVARGCPGRCGHCLNELLAEMHRGGPYVRRRSPQNICEEIDALCDRYPQAERVRFLDHAFALDRDWLERFVTVYADRCGMPFACHLRANAVDSDLVRLLEQGGCGQATVEIGSGSDLIRNEILNMALGQRQLERTFRLLSAANIRTTAIHLLGAPYETTVSIERTVELLERIAPDLVQTRLFAPLPGTRAEQTCRECGWLSGLGERAFRENQPMLRMPAVPPETIADAFEQFNWQTRHRRAAWLMRLLARIPLGRSRSLYDVLVKQASPNGRLLPADPRAIQAEETDGAISP